MKAARKQADDAPCPMRFKTPETPRDEQIIWKNLAFLVFGLMTCSALAQTLPPPTRDVFKCENNGEVVYSDVPCLGAKRVDIEPTRGLNKSSGTKRIGADVRRELHKEQEAQALFPIFGESAAQRAKRHRRAALSVETRARCERLDQAIPATETAETQTERKALPQVQERLLRLRTQFIELKC